MFPHQTKLEHGDTRLNELNKTLLVTGSLSYNPIRPGLGFSSLARQLILKFASSAWSNGLFHAYGLVRMLFWVNSQEMGALMPRMVAHKHACSVAIQKTHKLTEVVTPELDPNTAGKTRGTRDVSIEIENTAKVLGIMKQAKHELPSHRRGPFHRLLTELPGEVIKNCSWQGQDILEFLAIADRKGIPLQGLVPESVRRLIIEEAEVAKDPAIEWSGEYRGSIEKLSDFGRKVGRSRTLAKGWLRNRKFRSNLADKAEEIHKLECFILASQNAAEKQEAQAKIDILTAEYEQGKSSLSKPNQTWVESELDERLTSRSPAPSLSWDERQYEPLVMQNDEVWPPCGVSLLNMDPIPRSEGETEQYLDKFLDFLISMTSYEGSSLPRVLEVVAPGASELMEMVPALRDPAKGGRLNMNHLRARVLTREMMDGLFRAYMDWPFRPPGSDHPKYFSAVDSGVYPPDS